MSFFATRFNARTMGKKNKGVALVTALLVVSLATIMAVALSSRQYIDVRRTGNIMLADQAYLNALGIETILAQALAKVRSKGVSKEDNSEFFNRAIAAINLQFGNFGGGTIQIEPVGYPEARFNVNSLIDDNDKPNTKQIKRYRNLLVEVLRDLQNSTPVDDLVNPLVDWLDENDDVSPAGAEDSVYESKEQPYKTANRMMASASELRLVEGYTDELLNGTEIVEDGETIKIPGILAYVSALPDHNTTLNINLVDEPKQFMALSTYIEEQVAKDLIVGEGEEPYKDPKDFKSSKALDSISGTLKKGNRKQVDDDLKAISMDTQSSYFELKITSTLGQSTVVLNSLIFVNTSGTKFEVESRAIGTDGI